MIFYSWEINISYLPGPRMKYRSGHYTRRMHLSLVGIAEDSRCRSRTCGREEVEVSFHGLNRRMFLQVLGRGFWVKRTLILQTLENLSLGISVRCCRNGARKTNECCFS